MRLYSIRRIGAVAGVLLAGVLASSGAANAEFGVDPTNFHLGLTEGQPGMPAAQAAGHPDAHIDFKLNLLDPTDPAQLPDGTIRDLELELPEGLVANPTMAPECTMGRVARNFGEPCPRTSAVGSLEFSAANPASPGLPTTYYGNTRIYRVTTHPGEVAAFGARAMLFPVRMSVTVGPDGGYRVRTRVERLTEAQPLQFSNVTLWGVPYDHQGAGPIQDRIGGLTYGGPLTVDPTDGTAPDALPARRPFVSAPGRCDDAPLRASLTLTSWQTGVPIAPVVARTTTGLAGCDKLQFHPSITVTPKNHRAGKPSAYTVDVNVPQTDDAAKLSTPNLKDAVVTLPVGASISPPQAAGLDACTDAQLAIHSSKDEACPDASKIGTVRVDTPLLDHPVLGSIYVGSQLSQDPESGNMYRIFLTAKTDGVKIKLRGAVKADRRTGQLTASFLDNPQLPFSKFSLTFNGGDRAVLANPSICGEHETRATFTSWGGQTSNVSTQFKIDRGCPTGGFSPWLTAGMTSPWAGRFSPFTMTLGRSDADQDLSRINVALPSGVLGALGSVPLCGAAQAAAGTCPAASRIGSTLVAAGTGGHPYQLGGSVYLAGPYRGAPFSLSIVVPAKAGPYDLGTVVVRAALHVDAEHARVTAMSDRLPMIVGGVPIHLRMVNITMDRPGFMFNATSCRRQTISTSLVTPLGSVARVPEPYQARGCNHLKLDPALKIGLSGPDEYEKNGHPKLTADLSQTFGQTGLKRVKVVLPGMLALAADNAQELCKPAQAAARNCPKGSIVGRATARTPALHLPLSGPVYFVENTRRSKEGRVVKTLPKLWLKLAGEGVTLDLWATSEIDSSQKPQRLVTTFDQVPDAPIAGFRLTIDGGEHGILGATEAICALKSRDQDAEVTYTGQNEGVLEKRVRIAPTDCRLDVVDQGVNHKRAKVRVSGIGAGKLTISGTGVKTTHRTIKRAHVASITARLTRSGRKRYRDRDAIRLRVSWNPKAKGQKTQSVKATVKRAKASSTRAQE